MKISSGTRVHRIALACATPLHIMFGFSGMFTLLLVKLGVRRGALHRRLQCARATRHQTRLRPGERRGLGHSSRSAGLRRGRPHRKGQDRDRASHGSIIRYELKADALNRPDVPPLAEGSDVVVGVSEKNIRKLAA